MVYSLQALIQVLVPFFVVLLIFAFLYYISVKIRNKSFINCFKNDFEHLVKIVTVLLVFVTLLEMMTERIEAYKPYLVLEAGTGGCRYVINEGENKSRQYAIFDTNYSDETLSGDVTIPIRNIGVGVANNVEMEFSIDYNANSKRYFWFEEHYPAFALEDNKIIVDSSYMANNTFLSAPDIDTSDRQLHYESFVLPNNQETIFVRLPIDYLAAVRHYLSYSRNIDVPPLYLTIKYEDVQRVRYSQRFYLELSTNYVFSGKTGELIMHYTFTPEKDLHITYGGKAQNDPPKPIDYSKYIK